MRRPPPVTTDLERRQMLRWLIEEQGGPSAVAKASGVHRVTLHQLMTGERNLLTARASLIQRLLPALGLTGAEGIRLLAIPHERHALWAPITLRLEEGTVVPLDAPLVGLFSAPAGHAVRVRPGVRAGIVVCKGPGAFVSAPVDAVPLGAEVLGQLISIELR